LVKQVEAELANHESGKAVKESLAKLGGMSGFCAFIEIVVLLGLGLSGVVFYVSLFLLGFVNVTLLLLFMRGRHLRAHAEALSDVCGRRGFCAFCLYRLVDLEPPLGAQSPRERVCPECGGRWTLPQGARA